MKHLFRATIVVDNHTHTCNERLLGKYPLVISRKPLGGEISPGKVVRVFHGQAIWCSDIGSTFVRCCPREQRFTITVVYIFSELCLYCYMILSKTVSVTLR